MLRNLKLLLVEDLESDARLILREISRVGFTCDVCRVETLDEFKRAAQPDLDLIITDYMLPTMSADDVFSYVNACGFEIPVIVISGYIDDATAAELVWKGAADFLLKDRLARLGIAIESALSRRQTDDEKQMQYKILEESESRLSLALDTADLAVLTWQLNPERCTVDTRWASLVGIPLSEATEDLNCWLNRIHDADRAETSNLLEAMRLGRINHFTLQQRLRTAVGEWLWVTCKARVVRLDDSNQPLRACITFQDITAYRSSIAALERKTRMLDTIRVAQHERLEGTPPGGGFSSLLDGMLEMTQSRFGFITSIDGLVNSPFRVCCLAVASHGASPAFNPLISHLQKGRVVEIPELTALLNDVLQKGSPLFGTMPSGSPDLELQSTANWPLDQYLALPVRKSGKTKGLIFLGSPVATYDFEIVEELEAFIQTCAQLLSAWAEHEKREHSDQLLLDSERHFRSLSETGAILIWTTSPDGRLEYANPACRRFMDSPGSGTGSKSWIEIFVGHDKAEFESAFRTGVEQCKPVCGTFGALDFDGALHWLTIDAYPRRDHASELVGYVFYGHDNTARVQAERKSDETTKLLNQIFEYAPEPMILVRGRKIIRVNRVCSDQFRASQVELEGRLIDELLITPQQPSTESMALFPTRCQRMDGTFFDAEVNTTRVQLDEENITSYWIRESKHGLTFTTNSPVDCSEKNEFFHNIHRSTLDNLERIAAILHPHLGALPAARKVALQECVNRIQAIIMAAPARRPEDGENGNRTISLDLDPSRGNPA